MNLEGLKKSNQFSRVYNKGKFVVTKQVVMYYIENDVHATRVGYSVSKKVGKSVVRNRARRLIKEAFRLNSPKLEKGYDLVFVARAAMHEAHYKEVEKAVRYLLKNLKVSKS